MIASTFSFSAGEIWAMDETDLAFWLDRAEWLAEQRKPKE